MSRHLPAKTDEIKVLNGIAGFRCKIWLHTFWL